MVVWDCEGREIADLLGGVIREDESGTAEGYLLSLGVETIRLKK